MTDYNNTGASHTISRLYQNVSAQEFNIATFQYPFKVNTIHLHTDRIYRIEPNWL